MQISIVLIIFLLFSNVFKPVFLGVRQISEANCWREKSAVSRTMYHNTEMSPFLRETLTNSCTVCDIITIIMFKTSKLGLICST